VPTTTEDHVSTTTEEQVSTTIEEQVPTTTEDHVSTTTEEQVSATIEEQVPTTTEDQVSTTTEDQTASAVESTEELNDTEETVQKTTMESKTTAEFTTENFTTTPLISETSKGSTATEEFISKSTVDSTTTDEVLITKTAKSTTIDRGASTTTAESTPVTPSLAQNPQLQSNVPGVTLESLSEFDELPEGCFEGIEDLCLSHGANVTSCSNSTVSDHLVEQVLDRLLSSLEIPLPAKDTDSVTSVKHTSTCEGNQENGWIETYETTSTYSREPNTTYAVTSVLRTQTFTAVSFLQVRINSFGTSSVQYACQFMNGDAIEFSSIVGGIVSGYTIAKSQYDCTRYITITEEVIAGNYTIADLTSEKEFYDLSDEVGLVIEYLIVCIYIVLSYLAAFKAYTLYMKQRTRTSFKTNVNLSFVILFLVWASGNLLYMVLYSVALTDTNFFYIKSVLTLTYFATYFGFYLIGIISLSYSSSFRGIVNRIWKYPFAIDIGILVVSALVNVLYLIGTLLVEFCTGPGKDSNSPACSNVLNSSGVYLLYHSSEYLYLTLKTPLSYLSTHLSWTLYSEAFYSSHSLPSLPLKKSWMILEGPDI
jgi:hypothetical protein